MSPKSKCYPLLPAIRTAEGNLTECALLLEGGSLRSIYSAGVCDVLMEHGIHPGVIAGVSAGSLCGWNMMARQIGRFAHIGIFHRHDSRYAGLQAIASDGGENQSGSCSPGRGMGLEVFEMFNPEEIGRKAAAQAITNLEADYCPAGQMPVAIENGFGGVIFHEACGHSLEATSVGTGRSQMCGKLGQKIANEKVTAIDDGTIPNAWGSSNMDDEGHTPHKTQLIKDGICVKYPTVAPFLILILPESYISLP